MLDFTLTKIVGRCTISQEYLLPAKKGLLKVRVTEWELLEEKVGVAKVVLRKEGL